MYAKIFTALWLHHACLPTKPLVKHIQGIANQLSSPSLAEIKGSDTITTMYIPPAKHSTDNVGECSEMVTIIGRNSQQCTAKTAQDAKRLYMSIFAPDRFHVSDNGQVVSFYHFDIYNAGKASGTYRCYNIEKAEKKEKESQVNRVEYSQI